MPDLLFEKRDGVAWITFNRPEVKNALSPEAICRLADALTELREDDSLRLGVLTGAGSDMWSTTDTGSERSADRTSSAAD